MNTHNYGGPLVSREKTFSQMIFLKNISIYDINLSRLK
jgi:hypothetical protein